MLKLAMLVTMALSLGAPLPAFAFGTQSMPTDLDFDQCSVTQTNDFGTTWACPGYKGIPVMVAEAQSRFTVSYGLKSTEEPAAKQSLPPVNSPGPTIEWRLSNKEGRWKPFATIVHFLTGEAGKPKGDVLVVTRLGAGSTCQIAYVDAVANANAEELAQQAADAHGFDFDCKKEPEFVGKFGAWGR